MRAVDWRNFQNKGLCRDQFLRDARARRLDRGVTSYCDIRVFCQVRKPQLRMEIHRYTSYINPGVFSLRIPLPEQNRAFEPLRIMDDIIFYQPRLASKSRPSCLLGTVTASNVPRGPTTSLSDHQTISQLNQQNGVSKDQIRKSRGVNDPPQKAHASYRRCGIDTVQDQGTCRDVLSESLYLIF